MVGPLLNSQKVEIFNLVAGVGFSPALFEFGERQSEFQSLFRAPALLFKGTDFFFCFDLSPKRERVAIYSPGREHLQEGSVAANWGDMMFHFRNWLGYLSRESSAKDPWAELEQQAVSFGLELDENTPERPFSALEHRKVAQTLAVIQALLITYAKESGARDETIIAGIERLALAAESQDRKAWFQFAVGYIVSTATAMALDPEKTKALFTALRDGLKGVFMLIN